MADNQYRIDLGIGLNQSQLNNVKQILESIENQQRKVEYDVDFNIKNLDKLTKVGKEIEEIQTQLKGKTKNAIPIDTKNVETSLTNIHESIKKLQSAFGKVDSKKGVQSLLTTVNKIRAALEGVTKQFGDLNANLSNLTKKDFSLNFDFGFGNSSKNPEQAIKELNMLKKEVQEYENYFRKTFHLEGSNTDPINNLLLKYNQRSQLYGIQLRDAMSKGSDAQKISAYKEYIRLIKETASIGKISLEPVNFRLAESGEFIKVRNEASETQKQLQELFSGGINAENLHRTLDEIRQDLSDISKVLKDLSANDSFNGLAESFDRISKSVEELIQNANQAKVALGDGLASSVNVDTGEVKQVEKVSDDVTNAVIQNEKKKQEAYKATTDTVLYHAGVVSKLNKAETNGRFYGSNRGTGYFGTGHYFVDSATKHELDNNNYYNKLPYTSVDISKYDNLFKATTDEVADRLHTFLRNLTAFTQGSDGYNVSELFDQFKKVFGDTIMDIGEFGSRLDQLKAFMSTSSLDDRSDSVSTQFMKSLGYEGIDTRGTKYADTRYGTVIYDLKEESILQANITDELQKQGQMLEKINYAKGQAFDKSEDERIQGILDQQAKRKEIAEEFEKSFDTTNLKKAESDIDNVKASIDEVDEIINNCQHALNNLDKEYKEYSKTMMSLGIDDDEWWLYEDEDEWKESHTKTYQDRINELNQEKAELQSKIPVLEEVYNRENQLATEAYERAKQTVEQRHLEAQQAQETANTVVQSEERKRQASKETAGVIENLKTTLETMKVDRSSIDTITKDVEKLGFTVTDASVKMKNGDFDITVKGVDSMGRAITEIRHLDSAANEISGVSRKISQTFKESDVFIKQQKQSVANLTNQIEQLNRAANDQNASRAIKDSSHLETLKAKYNDIIVAIQRMENASSDTFIDEQNNVKKLISEYQSLTKELRNAENVATSLRSKDIDTVKSSYGSKLDVLVSKMQSSGVYSDGFKRGADNLRSVLSSATDASGLTAFLNGLDKLEAGYKRADAAAKEFNRSQKVGINVSGLESKIVDIQRISPEINQFETEINGAKVTVQSLLNDLKQVNTQGDFSVVNSRFKAFTDAAKAAGIAIAETATKVRSASDIKLDLRMDESGNFGISKFNTEIASLAQKARQLPEVTDQIRNGFTRVSQALSDMKNAAKSGDDNALIEAEKRYRQALEDTENQLKLNKIAADDYKREQKEANSAARLEQETQNFSNQIKVWLNSNTAAAKQFGDRIEIIQSQLKSCDKTQLDSLKAEFKAITQEAQLAGKTGRTFVDGLKAQFSKYSQYFSVASLFMYAEQGLRSMFEQVKLIDSAMTELKKVTDETDESYNKFLSNAATRSREIGTTIDGLVSSTADFARLGYGFEDAQGLAEVANIYAVVGDEINGVEGATESLISTMAAFKDEMNGMSNTDFAMSIIDKFNEIGNNFAISSGGIGEALERSASSLMAANNTIDESIALITAANTVVVLCHAA